MDEKGLRLKDKVIIITGGAQGIGRAYGLGMADEGAKLVVADVNRVAAENTVKEIQAKKGEALALETDVSSQASTKEMAEKTIARFRRIDILINNAAILEKTGSLECHFVSLISMNGTEFWRSTSRALFFAAALSFRTCKLREGGRLSM